MKTLTVTEAQYAALVSLCKALNAVDGSEAEQVPTEVVTSVTTSKKQPKTQDRASKRADNKTAYRRINGFLASATKAADVNDAKACAEALVKAREVANSKGWAHEVARVEAAAEKHGLVA